MSIRAYYNDHDKDSCRWLEQLINNGDITIGDVDDRSIAEIKPRDIAGYDRVHFFAGIGTWDYALNNAGWGSRRVWTASLPCQPFSAAGKGLGKDDERHLLPHFLELVRQCKPDTIIGEQVERAIGHGWLDDLQTNLEAEGYAVGHCVLGAHSVNAPHIRQRLYWGAKRLGNAKYEGLEGHAGHENSVCEQGRDGAKPIGSVAETGCDSGVRDSKRYGWPIYDTENNRADNGEGSAPTNSSGCAHVEPSIMRFAAIDRVGYPGWTASKRHAGSFLEEEGGGDRKVVKDGGVSIGHTNASDVDWLYCRDNKYRPIKSGVKPLVDGAAEKLVRGSDTSAPIEADNTQEARIMRLKGYGNAIQAQTAEAFIRAFMSI